MTSQITDLHVDVYAPAGTLIGTAGTILGWSYNEVVDGAGQWNMAIRATADNANLFSEGRRADVYGTMGGTESLQSSGQISGVNIVPNLDASYYNITGYDRMAELSNRVIISLDIVELDWTYLNAGKGAVSWLRVSSQTIGTTTTYSYYDTDLGPAYDGTVSTWGSTDNANEEIFISSYISPALPETATWVYVGYDAKFDKIAHYFASKYNTNTAVLEAQYYDGSGWTDLSINDGTSSGGKTWAQNGTVTFTRPSDWERYTGIGDMGNWYWVRERIQYNSGQVSTTYVRLGEMKVYADMPTTNGVNLIMAYAPSGWKTSGYAATAGTAYGALEDYSVLGALDWLREQVGGHFRSSNSSGTMQIDWLDTFASSGGTAAGTVH